MSSSSRRTAAVAGAGFVIALTAGMVVGLGTGGAASPAGVASAQTPDPTTLSSTTIAITPTSAETTTSDSPTSDESSTTSPTPEPMPAYGDPVSVPRGSTATTAVPTFTFDGRPMETPAGTTFALGAEAPDWATLAADGTITVAPPANLPVGTYFVPVVATIPGEGAFRASAAIAVQPADGEVFPLPGTGSLGGGSLGGELGGAGGSSGTDTGSLAGLVLGGLLLGGIGLAIGEGLIPLPPNTVVPVVNQ